MRAGLIMLAVLAALWSGAWFAAARWAERATETWFAETAAEGLRTGYDHLAVGGWPARMTLRLEGARLRDPATGLGWRGAELRAGVAAWAPHRPEVTLTGAQSVFLGGAEVALAAEVLRGTARLRLPAGRLAEVAVRTRGLALRAPDRWPGGLPGGWRMELAEGALRLVPQGAAPLAEIDLRGLGLAGLDWPADVAARPDGPVAQLAGRVAVVPEAGPAGRPDRIEVTGLELLWGATSLRGAGTLRVAPAGWPEGRIALEAEAWEPLVALAVALGLVAPEVAPTWLQVFGALQAAGETEGLLEVPLVFRNGRMSFGPLPLGPAPRIAPAHPEG